MQALIKFLLGASLACGLAANAQTADKGTPEQAIALVRKSVAYFAANGKEKALKAINEQHSGFTERDLYLYITDMNGVVLAHGANPRLVGKNLLAIKDVNGKAFAKDILEIAKAKGKGWVDYTWPNPVTQAVEAKSTYFEKTDEIVISCGAYK